MKRIFSIIGFVAIAAVVAAAQLTFNVNDLLGVKRVADPQLSPDGRVVAFTVGTVDKAANKVVNQIYTVNIDPDLSGRMKFLGHIPNRVSMQFQKQFSGDNTAGEIPLPFPNRADKPRRADGTIWVTVWESRSLPGVILKIPSRFISGWNFCLEG